MSTTSNSGPGYAKYPEHSVKVAPFAGRVVIEANGKVLADTRRALELREGSYPPVFYVPRSDVRTSELERTTHSTYCPFKGSASYYTIVDLPDGEDAVWSYERPFDEVLAIREALAFYPSKVHIRVEA